MELSKECAHRLLEIKAVKLSPQNLSHGLPVYNHQSIATTVKPFLIRR